MLLRRNKLPEYWGEGFANSDGSFNRKYLLHFQILGPAQNPDAAIASVGPTSLPGKIVVGLREAAQEVIFRKIRGSENDVWTCQPMGGAEYESGYFESMVTRTTLRSDLVTGTLDLTVKTSDYGAKKGLPAALPAKVYYICPTKLTTATQDMLTIVANGAPNKNEDDIFFRRFGNDAVVSHRGIGLVESVVYAALPDSKLKIAGAGEIYQSVFWFTDERAFTRACTYLGVTTPSRPTAAEQKAHVKIHTI